MYNMTFKEFIWRAAAVIALAVLAVLLMTTGCASISGDRPGYLSGKVAAVAYFETQNVPSGDMQQMREAARLAYHALDYLVSGEPLDDEGLILKAMSGAGVDSIGLKILALDFYRQAKARLTVEFPAGLTPEIVRNFKAGCDEVIAVYTAGK